MNYLAGNIQLGENDAKRFLGNPVGRAKRDIIEECGEEGGCAWEELEENREEYEEFREGM